MKISKITVIVAAFVLAAITIPQLSYGHFTGAITAWAQLYPVTGGQIGSTGTGEQVNEDEQNTQLGFDQELLFSGLPQVPGGDFLQAFNTVGYNNYLLTEYDDCENQVVYRVTENADLSIVAVQACTEAGLTYTGEGTGTYIVVNVG
jgi:hypothetical protein